jgi:hypothetical protein
MLRFLTITAIGFLVVLANFVLVQPASANPSSLKVSPVLECVEPLGGNAYRAWYGYSNPNGTTVTVPIGASNKFSPNPDNVGQPTVFLPGRHVKVFSVDSSVNALVWKLTTSTSTANKNSKKCSSPAPVINTPASPLVVEATSALGATVAYTATASGGSAPACSPASGSQFPLGDTTITCTSTSAEGLTSTKTFVVRVVDSTPPEINIPTNNLIIEATSPAGAIVDYGQVTSMDLVDGLQEIYCLPMRGSLFPIGLTTVTCTVTDAAGNSSTSTFTVTVQNTQNPTLNLPGNITLEATNPGGTAVSYLASASDAYGSPLVPTCLPPSGSLFTLGTTTVTCSASDIWGNATSGTFDVTITDNSPPELIVPSDITVEATSGSGAVVTWDQPAASDNADADPGVECSAVSGLLFPLGTTTVTCEATDDSGNTTVETFTVTVQDTTPPTISPTTLTLEASGPLGAVLEGINVQDTVDPSIQLTLVCDPPQGSYLPLGTSEVECTGTDSAGNETTTTVSVTVQDTTGPVVDPINDLTVEADTTGGALVDYPVPASNDLVSGPVLVSCAPESGSVLPLGSTPVTCTSTDNAGNTSTSTFTINVADTTEPTLSFTSPIVGVPIGGNSDWPIAVNDVADATPTVTCTPGSATAEGTYTVTCSAEDSAGNTSSSTSTVTVVNTAGSGGADGGGGTSVPSDSNGAVLVAPDYSQGFDPVDQPDPAPVTGSNPYSYTTGPIPPTGASYKVTRNYNWGYVKEKTIVTGKFGIKTWSWDLVYSGGSAPVLQADGSIKYGRGLVVLAPNVTNMSGVPIDDIAWTISGNTISLTINDAAYPNQYIIDPTLIYPPIMFPSWACWNINSSTFTCPSQPEYENIRDENNISTGSSSINNTTLQNNTGTAWPGPWGIRSGEVTTRTAADFAPHNLDDPLYPAGNSGNNAKDGWIYSGMGTGTLPSSQWTIDLTHSLRLNTGAGAGFRGIYEGRFWKIRRDAGGNLIGTPVPLTDKFTTGPGLNGSGAIFLNTTQTTATALVNPIGTTADRTFATGDALLLMLNFNIRNSANTANVSLAANNEIRMRLHQQSPTTGYGATAINFGVFTAPDLFLPANITQEATGPGGAVVNYTATATDVIDGSITPVCSHPSGSEFPVGTTTVTCIAENSKGLPMTSSFTVTVVDTTAPSLSLPANILDTATSGAGKIVNYSTTANDLVDGLVSVSCLPPSGSAFPVGITTVNCSAADSRGNTSSGSFTIEIQGGDPPSIQLDPELTVEATGPDGAVVDYTASALDFSGSPILPACAPPSGSLMPLGDTIVTCTATDLFGQATTDTLIVHVVDTTAPSLQLPSNITQAAVDANGAPVSYSVSATDLVDQNVDILCAPASASLFAIGTTTVNCSATDDYGNQATGSFTVTITDQTAPVITSPGDLVREATSSAGAEVNYTSSAVDNVDGIVSVDCLPESGSVFALGATVVNCLSTDTSGNSSSASFTVTVVDTTAPALDLPADITLEATSAAGAVATYAASATDIVDGALSPVCLPASGSAFALGMTTVNCTVEDAAGNEATGSFTVTVVDTTAPSLDIPADITLEATSAAGAVANYSASAEDIVDGALSPTCSPASGSTFPLGITTVNCSVEDAAGNETTGSFTVTVQDTTAPALDLPANITLEATSAAGAVANYSASASDVVDGALAPVCLPTSGSTFALGTTTVNCSVEDAAGNEATGSFTVTVVDTTAPSLDLPADITLEATSAAGAVANYSANANDIVDGALAAVCAPVSGATFALGTTTVNCSAEDAAGNEVTGSFTVTVVDTTAPALDLPADVTLEATSAAGAVANYSASAEDIVDGTLSPTCSPASGSTFPVGVTTVNCAVEDAAGNEATGSFTVTVVDTTAPVLDLPANITLEATSVAGAVANYSASAEDAVDGALAAVCAPVSGSMFPLGTTTVSCSVEDAAGNETTGSFTVTVQDTTAPALSLPSDMVVTADDLSGKTVNFTATANDIVDGVLTVNCLPASGALYPIGDTEVLCSVTDSSGNTSTGSFTITVELGASPTIIMGPDVTVEATSPSGAVAGFTASGQNYLGGALMPICTPASGSTFPLGATVVTCTVTDIFNQSASDTLVVTVVDTTAPVLDLPADITLEATSAAGAVANYSVSAEDIVDGALTPACTPDSGTVFALGTTTVSCIVQDAAGNEVTGSFTVTVVDTTAPTLDLPADITLEATSAAGAVANYSASANDTVDGNLVPACSPASGSVFALGTTTVNCVVEDAAGNEATGSFTVTVEDTTAPALDLPADITLEATSATGAVALYIATSEDVVDGPLSPICLPASGSTFGVGTTTVNCSVEDAAGNEATGSFTVTVVDTTAPALNLPANMMLEATSGDGAVATYTASATDIVDGALLPTCTPASGSTFPLGTTTVNCTVEDAAGNEVTGSFTVTVVDTTAPALDLPADITLEATSAAGAVANYSASASDIVDGALTPTCAPVSGSTFPLGTTTVNCSVEDAAGNEATGSFTVTVQDTTAPALDLPADMTREATGPGGATVNYTVASADTVDGPVTAVCVPASGGQFALGATTVNCTATDAAGNTSTGSFLVTVVDTTPPVIDPMDDLVEEATFPSGARAYYSVTATDLVTVNPLLTVTYNPSTDILTAVSTTPYFNNGDPNTTPTRVRFVAGLTEYSRSLTQDGWSVLNSTTAQLVNASVWGLPFTQVEFFHLNIITSAETNKRAWNASAPGLLTSCDYPSGSIFPIGVTTVTCSATDAAGNSSSDSFTVTVRDTTAPTLTLPADIILEATSSTGASATYTVSAVDLVDGVRTPVCTPVAGSTFPLGTTTVNCAVEDTAGNQSVGSFTVTVVDTTAPVLDLPADMTVTGDLAGGKNVNYSSAANDIVDGVLEPICSPVSGSLFAYGTTTVTCTVEDAAGNEASGSFTITVEPGNGPSITMPADITLEATSSAGAQATYTVTGSDFLGAELTADCSPASGSVFPLGVTTVTCTVEDSFNRTDTGTFTVTVQDTTDPVLDMPADMTLEASSPSGASATYTATATDTVSGALVPTCVPASGSTFGLGATLVTCSVQDGAGNEATGSFTVTVQDTTAPIGTLEIADADLILRGSVPATALVSDSATGVANVVFSIDGQGNVGDSSAPYTAGIDTTLVSDGPATVTALVSDNAGNSMTLSVNVVVDNTDPAGTISALSPAVASGSPVSGSITIGGNTSDATSGVASVSVSYTGPESGSLSCVGMASYTCDLDTTTLTDGSYTYSLTVTDVAGNSSTASLVLMVDNTNPLAAWASYSENSDYLHHVGPMALIYYNPTAPSVETMTVDINASDANGINRVTFPDLNPFPSTVWSGGGSDSSDPYSMAYSFSFGALEPGLVQAIAEDLAGNTTAADFEIREDSTGPAGGAISYADGYTNSGSITLSTNMPSDSQSGLRSVEIYRAEAGLIEGECGTIGLYSSIGVASGSSYTDNTLSSGMCYAYQLHAYDNVSNLSSWDSLSVVKVDQGAPQVEILSPTGAVNGAITLTAQSSDAESDVESVSISYTGPDNGSLSCSGTVNVSCSLDTTTLTDGVYTFTATATDSAGNTGTDAHELTIDNTDPVIVFNDYQETTNPGAIHAIGNTLYYNPAMAAGARVRHTVTDSPAGVASVQYPDLLGFSLGGLGGGSYEYMYNWSAGASEPGSQTVTATDLAGNSATGGEFMILRDSQAPTGGSLGYANGYGNIGAGITVNYSPGTDSQSGVGAWQLQRSTGELENGACDNYGAYATVSTASGPYQDTDLMNGKCYRYQLLVQDNVGNETVVSSTNVVMTDDVPPTGTINPDPAGPSRATVSLTGTASDEGSGVASSTLAYSGPASGTVCTTSATSWSCNWNTSALPDGVYTLTLSVTDNAGNTTPSAAQRTLEIDNTAPALTIDALVPTTGPEYQHVTGTSLYYNGLNTGSFRVEVSASDLNLTGILFPALANGWTPGGASDNTAPYNLEYSWTAGAEGAASAQVQANDLAGNSASAGFSVIEDSTAPAGGALSYTDGYTNNTSQSVAITLPADNGSGLASTTLQRRQGALNGGVCDTWGAWSTVNSAPGASYADTLPGEGCYQYRLLATDRVSNNAIFVGANTIKVDITAPVASNVVLTDSAAHIITSASNACYGPLATNETFVVSVNAIDSKSGVLNVQLPVIAGMGTGALNGQTLTTPVSGNTYQSQGGVYRFGSGTLAASGAKTITVTDLAGNTSSIAFSLSLDNLAPSAPTLSNASSAWQNTPSVTIAASDSVDSGCSGGVAGYEYELSGAQTGSGAGSSISITTQGVTLVRFRAIDNVGNKGPWSDATIRVDRSNPTLSGVNITESDNRLHVNGGSSMFYNSNNSNGAEFDVSVQASSLISPLMNVTFPGITGLGTGAGNGPDAVLSPSSGNTYETSVYAMGTAPYTAAGTQTITALNEAGNNSSASFTLIPDGDAPTSPTLVATPVTPTWTNAASVTVAASGSTDTGGSGVRGYAYTTSGATTVSGAGNSVAITAEGITIVSFTAIDNVNNVSLVSTYTVRIDRGAPSLTNLTFSESSQHLHSTGSSMYYNSSASSPGAGAQFGVSVDAIDTASGVGSVVFGTITGLGTSAQAGPATQVSPVSGNTYQSNAGASPGVYTLGSSPYSASTVNVTATDIAGGSSNIGGTLIADNTPPSLPSVTPDAGMTSWHCPVGTESILASGSLDTGAGFNRYQYNLGSGWVDGNTVSFTSANEGITNVTFRSVDNVGNASAATSAVTVRIDCTNPTANLVSITETVNPNNQHVIGNTAYYNPALSGTMSVNVAAADGASGIQGVQFGGLFSGWTMPSLVTGTSPYAGVHSWTAGATSPGARTAYAVDNAGRQSAGVNYNIIADSQAPEFFSAQVTNQSSSSGSSFYLNSSSAQVSINQGTDLLSGVRSWTLYRAQATYSGGACGVFNYAGAVARTSGTAATATFTDTGLSTTLCYQYGLEVVDNVSNTVRTFGVQTIILDLSPPVVAAPTIIESSSAIVVNTGPLACYRPSTVSGATFTVRNVVTDNISVQSVTHPQITGRLGTGAIVGPQTLAVANGGVNTYQYTYQFGTSVPNVGNTAYSVTALDGNNNTGSAAFNMQSDEVGPTAPASVNGFGYSYGTWSRNVVTLSPSGSTDTGSQGCAGVQRYQYTVNGGTTWNEMSGSNTVTLGPGGMVGNADGIWTISFRAIDNLGNIGATGGTGTVYVDTTPPTATTPYIYNSYWDVFGADQGGYGHRSDGGMLGWRGNNIDNLSGPASAETFHCASNFARFSGSVQCTAQVAMTGYQTISSTQKHIIYDVIPSTQPNSYQYHFCTIVYDNAGNSSPRTCASAFPYINYGSTAQYIASSFQDYTMPGYIIGAGGSNGPDAAWPSLHGSGYARIWNGFATCAQIYDAQPTLMVGTTIPEVCGAADPTRRWRTDLSPAPNGGCPTGGISGTGNINSWTQRGWIRIPYGAGAWIDATQGAYYRNATYCSLNYRSVYRIVSYGDSRYENFDAYPAGMNDQGQLKTYIFTKRGASGANAMDIDDNWVGRTG